MCGRGLGQPPTHREYAPPRHDPRPRDRRDGRSRLPRRSRRRRQAKPIPRPKLRDVTDTNDAQAYFESGLRTFRENPGAAADAFHWAARLNPGWADPLYARRVAVLSSRQTLLNAIMTNNRRDRPELRTLDSLQARAYMLNPFLYRRLDRQLFMTYLTSGNRQAEAELTYEINVAISQSTPAMQAWYAYSQGNFDRALQHYARA